jgi:hypothetical protein
VLEFRSHRGEPLMYFRGGYLRGPGGIENSHSGAMPSANIATRV